MSRSYKHTPYCGLKTCGVMKRKFNRRVRRVFDVPSGNYYRKMNESWEIKDFANVGQSFRPDIWSRNRYEKLFIRK